MMVIAAPEDVMTSITSGPKNKDDLHPSGFASGAGAAGNFDRLVAPRSEDAAPTMELHPDGQTPSAQPQWRREMEAALSEHRRAAASTERRLLDPVEVPSPNPSSTLAALPPCTATLRVGCRFVPQPSKSSMAATAPNPFGGPTPTPSGSSSKKYTRLGF